MIDAALETRGLGDNQPPEGDAVTVRLAEQYGGLPHRLNELLEALSRAPAVVTTDAQNKSFSDLKKQFRALHKLADTHRVAEKEFFLEGGRRVDGWFKQYTEPATVAIKDVTHRKTLYERQVEAAERRRREEAERLAREEAERLAREAVTREAAIKEEADLNAAISAREAADRAAADAAKAKTLADAKAADLSRSRSDHGAVSSLHTWWDFKDLERTNLDLEPLRSHLSMDALEKAVRSYIKAGGRDLAGVAIFEKTESRG